MIDIAKWCAQSEFFRYFFAGVLVLWGTTVSILVIFILTKLIQKHIDKKYGISLNQFIVITGFIIPIRSMKLI